MSTFEIKKPAGVRCQRSPSRSAQPLRSNSSKVSSIGSQSLRYILWYSFSDMPWVVRMPSMRYSVAFWMGTICSYSSIIMLSPTTAETYLSRSRT